MNPILPMVVLQTDRKRYLGRKHNYYVIRSHDVKLRSETINLGIKYPVLGIHPIYPTFSSIKYTTRGSTFWSRKEYEGGYHVTACI